MALLEHKILALAELLRGPPKFAFGSIAEIVDNQGTSSVIEQLAEPTQQVILGQTCSQFGLLKVLSCSGTLTSSAFTAARHVPSELETQRG